MSGAVNSTISIPNPNAQLAWLTPVMAGKLTSKLYAATGALALLMWDILLHLSQDYKILRTGRRNILTIVYFFARFSTLTYMMCYVIVISAPIGNCKLVRYVAFILPFALPASILHFVFRVSAIYNNNKYVFAFFMLSWLSVVGTSFFWPITVHGSRVGPTNYCTEVRRNNNISIGAACLLAHDSLIFLATAWGLRSYSHTGGDTKARFKRAMCLGGHLPKFTRSILRDGQAYYLASTFGQLLFVWQSYARSPFVYPCAVGIPAIILTTTMSAHVYRNIRLEYYRDYTNSIPNLSRLDTSSHQPHELPIVFNVSSGSRSESPGHEEKHTDVFNDVRDIGTDIEEVEKKMDV